MFMAGRPRVPTERGEAPTRAPAASGHPVDRGEDTNVSSEDASSGGGRPENLSPARIADGAPSFSAVR